MTVISNLEDAYFVASNSAEGFFSYYHEVFDHPRVKRVFAIKGGPGTGKSRFLREVAMRGEQAGCRCEYIYCSSDPDSLDGVILSCGEESIALMDATFPHVYEPSRPGVREEIINLGAFWDRAELVKRAETIETLNQTKAQAYERAYRYLAGIGRLCQNRDALVKPFVDFGGIATLAKRMMRDVREEGKSEIYPTLMRSIGMRGEVMLDTFLRQASKIYLIEDCRGIASYLMQELLSFAKQKGLRVRLSYDPVLTDRLDGMFLCESRLAFVVASPQSCVYPCKQIRMRRFLDTASMKGVRGEVNFCERMRRLMMEGATGALARVRELHFLVEKEYISSMQFSEKENFTKIFCEGLFGLQN